MQLQASILNPHHGRSVVNVQPYTNVTSKRLGLEKLNLFPRPKSSIQYSLRCKFQQESPLNQSTWLTVKPANPRISGFKAIFRPLLCGVSSNDYSAKGGRSLRDWIELVGKVVSTAFPIWVTRGCVLGLMKPSAFNWVTPKFSIRSPTIIMLGIGMTLTHDGFRGILAMPEEVLSGFVLQYSVMTPFLTAKLAGQYVVVDAAGLLMSTLEVVLIPVLAGALLNQYFQPLVKFVSPLMPSLAAVTVTILCGNAISQSASVILMSDEQNSMLGVVLATQHFGNPLTAVPSAVSSVCQSIFGSGLVGIWRRSVPPTLKD